MKNILKIAAASIVLGTPTLVSAGDDWTGFYMGAYVAGTDFETSTGVGDGGTAYGLQAGYNYSLASDWVVGGELSYGTAAYSVSGVSGDLDTIRLKGKLGYDFGSTMLYGVLGWGNFGNGTDSEDGYTYGIGIGYKATDNVILGAELLQDSFALGGVDYDVTSLGLNISYQF